MNVSFSIDVDEVTMALAGYNKGLLATTLYDTIEQFCIDNGLGYEINCYSEVDDPMN